MDANQFFKAGKLTEAVEAQTQVVAAQPADQGQRLFLFELLVFAGDLDRAQTEIEAIHYEQPEIDAALLVYRKMLDAERSRRLVFTEKAQPEFLADPPDHVRARIFGLWKIADGAPAEAAALFQTANGQIPALKGTLDGKPFDGLRDGDDRLGSVLEVIAHGHYYWVPLEQVQTLTISPPRFPRDLIWIPAHMELRADDAGQVYLPAHYPGTEKESDPQLKLGRLTDWRGEAPVCGVGLKTFFVGADESSLLDWRKLELE